MSAKNIRIYVSGTYQSDREISLEPDQSHYLSVVMRSKLKDHVQIFNEAHGDWIAEITSLSKREVQLTLLHQIRDPLVEPEIHLYFSLLKPHRLVYLIEKGVEVGVTHFHPVIFGHSQFSKINLDKARSQILTAIEQSNRQKIPQIHEPKSFQKILDELRDHPFYYGDERLVENPAATSLQVTVPIRLVVGPEGGFTPLEFKAFDSNSFAHPLCLGSTLLRAETATTVGVFLLRQNLFKAAP